MSFTDHIIIRVLQKHMAYVLRTMWNKDVNICAEGFKSPEIDSKDKKIEI